MKSYQKINSILGWVIFAIASIVYIMTAEPTASFWDCGEYIATAYKLQVGHPPGAPLFQMIGRFFTMFAFGDVSRVAFMVNMMSALSSSLTILFLFWTLTMLAKKLALRSGEMTEGKKIAIFGSAIVGSLAYTFSDSFWFSAVEGEVYAMSSFFTALVFWAILKWEEKAEEEHSFRWLIFIAYMMGLSVGVHLLNLLAIPAIAFVYYFKNYKKPNYKGMLITFIISILILGFVMSIIIPWIVKLPGFFELFFVNTIGLPFNSGTIIYFILLIAGIFLGIRYTRKKRKVVLNTIIWALTFILIGYSSFFMLVIRSNVNPPIDENSPEDAISLLSYLNREQYGDWPILHGQYFNAPVVDRKDGNPVYRKSAEKGKYIIIDDRKGTIPVYDSKFTTIFPRMWNNTEQRYINDYKTWSKMKGIPTKVTDEFGESKVIDKPTFQENLRYFFRYQVVHMYFRYFMWNFSGRQNDIQGTSDRKNGNWITGIRFLDHARIGPIHDAPKSLQNKATNTFYLLPLLLGIIGIIYQLRRDNKNFMVVFLLFFMTGLAILVYLNQHSPQPRERDYAYAASFYAFAIWIGLGVYALFDWFKSFADQKIVATAISGIILILVPGIMANEGWDDHDRSNRYTALATANNYLNSCAPNAILFTNGDNDTFPLWYAQEVEGIRTDVRVVNLSLLNTEWYIDQMKRKAYDSEPVPFSLSWEQYKEGTRNYTYFIENENIKGHVELKQLFDLILDDPTRLTMQTRIGPLDFFPTKKFKITIDSAMVIEKGVVSPENADKIVDEITWTINRSGITKNYLMLLDLLATNNWERPVYFAITTGSNAYIGLQEYFQLEGLAYRLVPIRTVVKDRQEGRTETGIMYDNLVNKFQFGNMGDPNVYLDETNMRMTMNLRNNYFRLAEPLIKEGKYDSARIVIDRCLEEMPDENIPFNFFVTPLAEGYYKIGDFDKGNELNNRLIKIFEEQLAYYFDFPVKLQKKYDFEKQQNLALLQKISQVAGRFKQEEVVTKASEAFDIYFEMYNEE
ncbi:MAG: DUF2723 domain-containing protein [Bacteroidales bacterium]|nr:DUF2723 domain-containing protein [Bacteroidales bacterium]